MTHGESRPIPTPEYQSWAHMKNRCKYNPNYTKRGITYDPRWEDYTIFLIEMGRRPTPQHTLERKNNNKGYNKKNCIWASRKIQGMNTQTCKLSQSVAEAIRDRYAEGRISQRQLGKLFGVHQSQVSRVVNEVTW